MIIEESRFFKRNLTALPFLSVIKMIQPIAQGI